MSPWLYALRRILQSVPLFFGVISITFLMIHTAPGSPITFLAGEYGTDPVYIAKIERMFGLDQPLYIQLFKYIVQVCKGELGFSFIYMQPVSTIIFKRMGTTLQLMALVILFSTFFGVMLGVISSKKPYSLLDNITNTLSLVGYSIPVFWMGQLLLLFFALKLSWLPTGGLKNLRVDYTGIWYALDVLYHLILPAMALGSIHTALIARMQRASMLEELGQDYIITARAKGLKENAVIYKHALRNALLPVVTVIGFTMGYMITGAVLTETVFGLPGLGTMMKDAIYQRDYPIIMAVFVFSSIFTIIANLITDIAYSFLDPRIRYQ
jgi:ABC-type dipeptide/oligopeptide/nickel transport system permease component